MFRVKIESFYSNSNYFRYVLDKVFLRYNKTFFFNPLSAIIKIYFLILEEEGLFR